MGLTCSYVIIAAFYNTDRNTGVLTGGAWINAFFGMINAGFAAKQESIGDPSATEALGSETISLASFSMAGGLLNTIYLVFHLYSTGQLRPKRRNNPVIPAQTIPKPKPKKEKVRKSSISHPGHAMQAAAAAAADSGPESPRGSNRV
jgi:hypothetical protein